MIAAVQNAAERIGPNFLAVFLKVILLGVCVEGTFSTFLTEDAIILQKRSMMLKLYFVRGWM